jgi:hypothetical protein
MHFVATCEQSSLLGFMNEKNNPTIQRSSYWPAASCHIFPPNRFVNIQDVWYGPYSSQLNHVAPCSTMSRHLQVDRFERYPHSTLFGRSSH